MSNKINQFYYIEQTIIENVIITNKIQKIEKIFY